MSYGNFKQYDSRWGRNNYNGSSSMATAGCGPTSVANLVYAVDGKTNPWDVALFMKKHGYAIRNQGTAWDGIPAAMKHGGLIDVKNVNVDETMNKVWEYLAKGYCADFLFRAGSRGGICWTTDGHFVSVTGYKVKDGKHYLYTRDSGGRNHTGWYCYETQMRGLIRKVWVGKVPSVSKNPIVEQSKKNVKASVPSYSIGKTYKTLVDCLNVREGAGVNYKAKAKNSLSKDAQKHCNSKGQLNKGTIVTCLDVKKNGNQVWIKIPSGWICAYNGVKKYVS